MSNELFCFYSQSSFLEGVGRLVDFTGSLNEYNLSKTPKEADAHAIRSDWKAVGLDLMAAAKQQEEKPEKK